MDDPPIRQKSANGQPRPNTSIERTCARCRASFLGLAYGATGERGIWTDWNWFCSQECFDAAVAFNSQARFDASQGATDA